MSSDKRHIQSAIFDYLDGGSLSGVLENDGFHRQIAFDGNGRADGPRRADQWCLVLGLCGPGVGFDIFAWRLVMMDNLGSYKRLGIRAAIEAAGARLVNLPLYNPDFNPIENAIPS